MKAVSKMTREEAKVEFEKAAALQREYVEKSTEAIARMSAISQKFHRCKVDESEYPIKPGEYWVRREDVDIPTIYRIKSVSECYLNAITGDIVFIKTICDRIGKTSLGEYQLIKDLKQDYFDLSYLRKVDKEKWDKSLKKIKEEIINFE